MRSAAKCRLPRSRLNHRRLPTTSDEQRGPQGTSSPKYGIKPLWKISLLAAEGFSGRRTHQIRLRTLTDTCAIVDRASETGRKKDVYRGELFAYQVGAPVPQSDIDV